MTNNQLKLAPYMSSSFVDWPELEKVVSEKRCEAVIHGSNKSKKRELDVNTQLALFHENSPLNFVEFVSLNLKELHPSIAHAKNLSNLVLRSNHLTRLPEEIGQLVNLKLLDCSNNVLTSLPTSMKNLKNLATLNLSNNQLTSDGLFNFTEVVGLQHVDLSNNCLEKLPDSLLQNKPKLQELILDHNKIAEIPSTFEALAPVLKTLSLVSNSLVDLPFPLKDFHKLKVLNLKNNTFSDKRFLKLVADPRQNSTAILDYLKKKTPKEILKEKPSRDDEASNDLAKLIVKIGVSPNITRTEAIASVRPYIICCILRNLDLSGDNVKMLISIHNKIHDSICNYRTTASIGFHDITKFEFPLTYTTLPPDELKIMPLGKSHVVTAKELVTSLNAEAEAVRKKQKKNSYSSAYKYLHLIKNLEHYPCLVDAKQTVLSLAPVTNSETTKIGPETKDIFVEVTSQERMQICRDIMTKFINEVSITSKANEIIVEQIKVVHENGNLLSAYPDKNDLTIEDRKIERIYVT